MRKYETVIILSPELGEGQLKDELKKFENFLSSHGATNIKVERWAKRELGFKMRKHKLGNFAFVNFETTNTAIAAEVTSILRITDPVLKFQIHRISDKVRKFKGTVRRNSSLDSGDDFGDVDVDFLSA